MWHLELKISGELWIDLVAMAWSSSYYFVVTLVARGDTRKHAGQSVAFLATASVKRL